MTKELSCSNELLHGMTVDRSRWVRWRAQEDILQGGQHFYTSAPTERLQGVRDMKGDRFE